MSFFGLSTSWFLTYSRDPELSKNLILHKKIYLEKCNKLFFTMWGDVGKGDLHETLQGQKDEARVDDQTQELTCFTFREQQKLNKT